MNNTTFRNILYEAYHFFCIVFGVLRSASWSRVVEGTQHTDGDKASIDSLSSALFLHPSLSFLSLLLLTTLPPQPHPIRTSFVTESSSASSC